MQKLCPIVDNLYWAAVCLLGLMIILHLRCHAWRIAWNRRLQPVLALVSWALCFAAKHGAVPGFLSGRSCPSASGAGFFDSRKTKTR